MLLAFIFSQRNTNEKRKKHVHSNQRWSYICILNNPNLRHGIRLYNKSNSLHAYD